VSNNLIFVSIASYRDKELGITVFDILNKANNPKNVVLSILSQDKEENHPNLELIFSYFKVEEYFYKKIHFSESTGVGFARAETQKYLSDKYKYYLQVDSHSQFVEDWDVKLVEDYEKLSFVWGDFIMSSYPGTYTYSEHGVIQVGELQNPTSLSIILSENKNLIYEPKYKEYTGGEDGDCHGYFCGGFAFGYSKYFLDTPYDPKIYFNGEEQTLSIRFYCKGIKIVAPPKNYVYHHYTGLKRIRNWEDNPGWEENDRAGKERLKDFFNNSISGTFGIPDTELYKEWVICYVKQTS
jgi:hypothetical protein